MPGVSCLLTGFALPLLPDTPLTDLTAITPRQVWLAMVAVCSVSYASYLLQRYVAPTGGILLRAPFWVVLFVDRNHGGACASRAARAGDTATGADRRQYRRLGDVPKAADRHFHLQPRPGVLWLRSCRHRDWDF